MFIVVSDLPEPLMFIVVSDLPEPRERYTHKFPFSVQGMNVTITNSVCGIVLCAEKLNGESCRVHVSGHGSSANRTFFVEDCTEVDFGQWVTDEVTGEQGHIDEEGSCFWTWDDNECARQSRPFNGRQVKRRKGKAKEKVKEDPKGPEKHSLAMNKHKILSGGQKRTLERQERLVKRQ